MSVARELPALRSSLEATDSIDPDQTGALDFMSFPGLNFDLSTPVLPKWYPDSEVSSEDQSILQETHLPSYDLLVELVDLFFEHLYHVFPCFHQKVFIEQVQLGTTQSQSPILLFAICCVTARFHLDATVRQREREWYEQAKFSYQLTQRNPDPALPTIQAALLIIEYACTAGDFSSAWLFLGKAWRQAIALGMNRMDASSAVSMDSRPREIDVDHATNTSVKDGKGLTAVDKEERRRTMWLLFIVDRYHSWPTGWPNALPETHFKVDIPVADSSFQAMDPFTKHSVATTTPFTRKLSRLITSSNSANEPVNVFRYICIAHVLLGRVAELVHSLHDSPNTPEYVEECEELDSYLVKLRLSIPRQATSVLEAQSADRGLVVWIQVVLDTSAMLLNYRCTKNDPAADASSRFLVAVAAARHTAQVIRDASRVSIELLITPHIASSLYIAALVLVIEWRTTGDAKLKEEIDLIALVFDRMNEAFAYLGLKFKYALEHDLERSQGKKLEELRELGLRGLLADCSKWSHIKDKLVKNGIHIDIT
ncbi:hypothetical protein HBH46_020210 [Parastagonospora nodorum]|nr:hypothetical protein HBH46_020210 [Parastagonospora nodorum]KAH5546953.1 hypothetical protein HBI27_042790 [Parastagonospora nodorum]KAH5638182.1 hypothetical protein HBI51_152250 [Parastagonospora nodorum]